jgi:uncharacterized protein YcfL
MSKYILVGITLALLLNGCASNPDVQLVELSQNTVVYDEIIRINNCGGKGESEQTASREFATTVEFGAGVSAGYQSVVQGNLSAKYSEYRNTSKSQRLVAPPETNMEFVLRWSDDVRAGNVQVNGNSGTYEVRIPISVEQISSRDWGCSGQQTSQATLSPPISQTNIPAPTKVTTGYIPTCNWARDWELQPDGSYLWIGFPPGSSNCQNVGQDGELLQRLRNGENIKLIVNVGNNFVGLNICKGKYNATEIIPGEICVPKNPELWPKVKGTLIVTESDGFSVGTGK